MNMVPRKKNNFPMGSISNNGFYPFQDNFFTDIFGSSFNEFVDQVFNNETRLKDFIKSNGTYPKVDFYQLEDEYLFMFSVPGVNKDALKVEYDPSDGTLWVEGESKINNEKIEKSVKLIREIKHSKFKRGFTLPRDKLDLHGERKIITELENGILEIRIPVIGEKKEKIEKIEIKVK